MFLNLRKFLILLFSVVQLIGTFCLATPGQTSPVRVEEVHVVTFPSNRKVAVPFVAGPKFPGVTGKAHVDLNERGVATVKADFNNLPSLLDIGGLYSAYVVWAVSADGSTQRMGELKVNAEGVSSGSKIDADVQLSAFGMLVTVEPHYMVRMPSRAVVLKGGAPFGESGEAVKSIVVQYQFNENDYFRARVKLDKKKEKEYRKTPLLLLGAQNAIYLAREAGAEIDAPDLYNEAVASLEQVQALWQGKGKEKEIELLANKTIGLGANAEKKSIENRKERRETHDKTKTAALIGEAQEELEKTKSENQKLHNELDELQAERDRLQREFQDKFSQSNRLEKENVQLKQEAKEALEQNVRLKIENEKLQGDLLRIQGAIDFGRQAPILEKFLSVFGRVQRKDKGLSLTLPESNWIEPELTTLNPANLDKLGPLFKKIADLKYLEVAIFSYTGAWEDPVEGQAFAEARAKNLVNEFIRSGVAANRIRTQAFLQNEPGRLGQKPKGGNSNRVEIQLKLTE